MANKKWPLTLSFEAMQDVYRRCGVPVPQHLIEFKAKFDTENGGQAVKPAAPAVKQPVKSAAELEADWVFRLAREQDRKRAVEICNVVQKYNRFDLLVSVIDCDNAKQAETKVLEVMWVESLKGAAKWR